MTLCVESFIGAEAGKKGVKLEEQVLLTEAGAASSWLTRCRGRGTFEPRQNGEPLLDR